MTTTYAGEYARFETLNKNEGALLTGPDFIVGEVFDVHFEQGETDQVAWMNNRWGKHVGYFNENVSRRLSILSAQGFKLKAIYSFVAYTDIPDPGHYWGEVALVCYAPAYEDEFSNFIKNVSKKIQENVRIQVDLSEEGISKVIESKGEWIPKQTVPMPKQSKGTIIMKKSIKESEKMIEKGRAGNKGCYVVSWAFVIALVILAVFGLRACGLF